MVSTEAGLRKNEKGGSAWLEYLRDTIYFIQQETASYWRAGRFLLVSPFFLLDKLPELILGIILSFSGSVILAIGDSGLQGLSIKNPSFFLGDVLALLGAIMTSGYLMVGSKLRQEMDVLSYISVVYTFSACFLLIASVSWGILFIGYKASSYLYMALPCCCSPAHWPYSH